VGWGSGGDIFETVALSLDKNLREKGLFKQKQVLLDLIEVLEQGDCDTLEESFGTTRAGDNALKQAGYHHYKPETCDGYIDDYTCACGFVED